MYLITKDHACIAEVTKYMEDFNCKINIAPNGCIKGTVNDMVVLDYRHPKLKKMCKELPPAAKVILINVGHEFNLKDIYPLTPSYVVSIDSSPEIMQKIFPDRYRIIDQESVAIPSGGGNSLIKEALHYLYILPKWKGYYQMEFCIKELLKYDGAITNDDISIVYAMSCDRFHQSSKEYQNIAIWSTVQRARKMALTNPDTPSFWTGDREIFKDIEDEELKELLQKEVLSGMEALRVAVAFVKQKQTELH